MSSSLNYGFPNDSENRNLIVFVSTCECCEKTGWSNINAFETEKESIIKEYSFEIENENTFFIDPPKFIKNHAKAVIFEAHNFIQKDGSTNFKLRQKIANQLANIKIPFGFIENNILNSMSAMIQGNIEVQNGDTIIFICIESEILKIIEFSRNENENGKNGGFIIDEIRNIILYNKEGSSSNGKDLNHLKSEILGSNNPEKIIATKLNSSKANATMKLVRATFKSKKFMELTGMNIHDSPLPFKALKKIVENIYDSKETKFHFIPQNLNNYVISFTEEEGGIKESDVENNILMEIKENETLPLEKSCFVSKIQNTFNLLVLNKKSKTYESQENKITAPNDCCHKIKLILTIDIHNYVTFSYEAIIIPEIETIPAKLNKSGGTSKKIPIIGLFDNSSIICVWNENKKCYKFLKSWNGKYGKNLILSLEYEKPKIIETLPPKSQISSSSIVYDIIKIMSMEPNNIKMDPTWGFKVITTKENPILLQFQYFDKTTKASSLPFLMALILKNHNKSIKKEIGKKPNELGFYIFDENNFDAEQTKRIQEGITKACKLLNISSSFCKL